MWKKLQMLEGNFGEGWMDFYSREKLEVFWDVCKFLRFKVLKKKVRLLKECGDIRLSR